MVGYESQNECMKASYDYVVAASFSALLSPCPDPASERNTAAPRKNSTSQTRARVIAASYAHEVNVMT